MRGEGGRQRRGCGRGRTRGSGTERGGGRGERRPGRGGAAGGGGGGRGSWQPPTLGWEGETMAAACNDASHNRIRWLARMTLAPFSRRRGCGPMSSVIFWPSSSRGQRDSLLPLQIRPRGCPRSHAHSPARSRQHHLGGSFLDPWQEVDSFGNLLSSTQQLVADAHPAREVKTFDSEKGEFSVYK